jgi:hypothetical protein
MNRAVLIQQASGQHAAMLEITAQRHADYCARHGITYWSLIGDVQFSRSAHWNKIVLVQHALELGFETVAWLDADTLIVRDDEDIRGALNGGGPLGLALHPLPGLDDRANHYNSGVMIMRNTSRTREFFNAVWEKGPLGNHQWHEQARILDLLPAFPDLVQPLDPRWNATNGLPPVRDPIIKAWHGIGPGAFNGIYTELKQLGAADARVKAIADSVVHIDNADQHASRFIETIPPCPSSLRGRGIVIGGGGLGYFTCAWVCIHQLRRLGCTLPIQLWYLGPRELDSRMRSLVAPLGVECVDALEVRRRHPARSLDGWPLKPYSVLHSPFREVLLLDADNVPVVNPEFLFDTPEFRETGAIFWPDRGRMKPADLPWKVFGVPFRDEPEFESGQIVVDKEKCWRPLRLAMWFNEHSDFYYQIVHGDKDTFRFAWHRLGQAYAMPPRPMREIDSTFCQHDFSGRLLFQHRNENKWNYRRENKRIAGFQFEEDCLNDVRRLRSIWDGKIGSC